MIIVIRAGNPAIAVGAESAHSQGTVLITLARDHISRAGIARRFGMRTTAMGLVAARASSPSSLS
ncbi:MAG: hypothetical protein V6Z86_00845 [Hyphomicrobiales bacterium]